MAGRPAILQLRDCHVAWNFLDHLPAMSSVLATIKHSHDITKPCRLLGLPSSSGGRIIISTITGAGWDARARAQVLQRTL